MNIFCTELRKKILNSNDKFLIEHVMPLDDKLLLRFLEMLEFNLDRLESKHKTKTH